MTQDSDSLPDNNPLVHSLEAGWSLSDLQERHYNIKAILYMADKSPRYAAELLPGIIKILGKEINHEYTQVDRISTDKRQISVDITKLCCEILNTTIRSEPETALPIPQSISEFILKSEHDDIKSRLSTVIRNAAVAGSTNDSGDMRLSRPARGKTTSHSNDEDDQRELDRQGVTDLYDTRLPPKSVQKNISNLVDYLFVDDGEIRDISIKSIQSISHSTPGQITISKELADRLPTTYGDDLTSTLRILQFIE